MHRSVRRILEDKILMLVYGYWGKCIKLRIILYLFITMVSSGCMANSNCNVTVYYLPLEIEFYLPPTLEYIKEYGDPIERSKLGSVCDLINHISTLKGEKELHGEEKRLRILIIDHNTNKNIYLTSNKKIVMDEKLFEVSDEIFGPALMEILSVLSTSF